MPYLARCTGSDEEGASGSVRRASASAPPASADNVSVALMDDQCAQRAARDHEWHAHADDSAGGVGANSRRSTKAACLPYLPTLSCAASGDGSTRTRTCETWLDPRVAPDTVHATGVFLVVFGAVVGALCTGVIVYKDFLE